MLDRNKIKKNSGLRSLAKLCLNSIWGKFGERDCKVKKTFINERDHLLNLITNPSNETLSLYELSSEALLVSYKLLDECLMKQPNVNVAIAAYTTAHARLHLYKYLDLLKDKALYHDTDSVVFIKSPNDEGLPLGDYLGQLTDELIEFGENSYIDEAVFSSEKSYAFVVKTPNKDKTSYVCKVKGITLNYENSQLVNFESMKNMVLNSNTVSNDVINLNIARILRAGDSTVYTENKEYKFKVNATKRRRVGDEKIYTLPYGYTSDITQFIFDP